MNNCKVNTIALLTDFGLKGAHYVASMKAVIYRINPKIKIVDISHFLTPFSVVEASYILKSTYSLFPEGTIFIVVVDPGVGSERKILILKSEDNYYFIGPDNGIFSLLINSNPSECIIVENEKYFHKPVSNTFHGRDIMSPVGAYLSKGVSMNEFGPKIYMKDLKKVSMVYEIDKNCNEILCTVQYIDDFGNIITNIKLKNNKIENTEKYLKQNQKITIHINGIKHDSVYKSHYTTFSKNSLLIIKGSTDYLEISINQGNASKILNASSGDIIKIRFD